MSRSSVGETTAWAVTQRRLEYEGELRTAIMRALLVSIFYAVQLVHYSFFAEHTPQALHFHRAATLIASAWLCLSMTILVSIARRWFPSGLKYFVTAADLALLTIIASQGAGPGSPVAVLFFLIIALGAARFSLPLIWFTTLGSMGCYWLLVGMTDHTWFDADHVTPPIEQAVRLLGMGATGVVLGQVVRMVRRGAENFSRLASKTLDQGSQEAGK